MIETVAIVALILLLLPVQIYVGVKLGTYAYYRGRYLFQQDYGESENGDSNKKTT